MKLESIFHKRVNRKKMKVWEFQSHMLSSFSAIKNTVTGVEGEGGCKQLILLKKNYDYGNTWNLKKTTVIVIISKSG